MVEVANEPQPLTPVVFHVLLALSDAPMHGYAVMKRVEEDSGLRMGPGTVYGSIHRLTEAGWVRDAGADLEDARRGRRFALTHAGRRALQAKAARITRLARLPEVDGGDPELTVGEVSKFPSCRFQPSAPNSGPASGRTSHSMSYSSP